MVDCCDFWTLKKNVKTNQCIAVSCDALNQTFDDAKSITMPVTEECLDEYLLYDDDIMCSSIWYYSPYNNECDGLNPSAGTPEVTITPTIDVVILVYSYPGTPVAEEEILSYEIERVAITADSTYSINDMVLLHTTHFKVIAGTLDGEEIIEDTESVGTVDVTIQYQFAP